MGSPTVRPQDRFAHAASTHDGARRQLNPVNPERTSGQANGRVGEQICSYPLTRTFGRMLREGKGMESLNENSNVLLRFD